MQKPKFCEFPSTTPTRLTRTLDFANMAAFGRYSEDGFADTAAVIISNAEEALQMCGLNAGEDYSLQDILTIAAPAIAKLTCDKITFNMGYAWNSVPEEDYKAWIKATNNE